MRYLLIALLLVAPVKALADMSLPWSTTFGAAACESSNVCSGWNNTCDGLRNNLCGTPSKVTSAANMPSPGEGGFGLEHGQRSGTNNHDGGLAMYLTSNYDHVWLRWYMKYPAGFNWSSNGGTAPDYNKLMLPSSQSDKMNVNFFGNEVGFRDRDDQQSSTGSKGWPNIMGGTTGDGQWHCYEIEIDDSAGGANGIFRFWVDGILLYTRTNYDFDFPSGIDEVQIGSNAKIVGDGGIVYYDDIAMVTDSWGSFVKDAGNNDMIGPLDWDGGPGPDTDPPSLDDGSPSGEQVYGTTSVDMSLITTDASNPVTCKYDTDGGESYGAMANTFSTTGGSYHEQTISGLSNGSSYTYYVRCIDDESNVNGSDYTISWSVAAADGTAPVVLDSGPSGEQVWTTTEVSMTVTTDEAATCKYDTDGGESYAAMANTFSTTGTASHSQTISGLQPLDDKTYYVRCTDGTNPMTSDEVISFTIAGEPVAGVLLTEGFEDSSFSARGWYDNTSWTIETSNCYSGNCLVAEWGVSDTQPDGKGSMRYRLDEARSEFYIQYWMKLSADWQGSGEVYHPHLWYMLSSTDADGDDYPNLSWSYLNVYVEQNDLTPRLVIKDAKQINEAYGIPSDLIATTENRSVSGCNGNMETHGWPVECYESGGDWLNGKTIDADSQEFSLDTWHKVSAYFKLNTVGAGVTNEDGIVRYWVDDVLTSIDYDDVVFRTSDDPNILFEMLVFAPYIGPGSPIAQEMWIDELTISTTEPLTGDTTPPFLSQEGPTSQQPSGTTQVDLTVTVSDMSMPAVCKYDTDGGEAFAVMSGTFDTITDDVYTQTITGLTDGSGYTYYVRCEDTEGNANDSDLTISFSVADNVTNQGGNGVFIIQ